jgi:hypothetical protein
MRRDCLARVTARRLSIPMDAELACRTSEVADYPCVVTKYLLTVKASFRIMRNMETASMPTAFLFPMSG